MAMFSVVQRLFFPPPPSVYVNTMTVVSLATLAKAGISEVTGKHLQYSKFWDSKFPAGGGGDGWMSAKISSRAGMLVAYTPAFLGGLASFWGFPVDVAFTGPRGFLLCSALTIHFLKRVLEVLFVHQFSGHVILESMIPISLSYFISTVTMIYAQHLTTVMPEPFPDLKHLGVVLFLVGIIGNFYHHHILSKLREKNDKAYKIPKGGLFELVICPHYMFEIIVFIGVTFISQTLYALAFTLGTICYLTGRSYATRRWYLSKFENFPRKAKVLVPFIF